MLAEINEDTQIHPVLESTVPTLLFEWLTLALLDLTQPSNSPKLFVGLSLGIAKFGVFQNEVTTNMRLALPRGY